MEKSQAGSVVINKNNKAVPPEKGKVLRKQIGTNMDTGAARKRQRDEWKRQWDCHVDQWQQLSSAEFPNVSAPRSSW